MSTPPITIVIADDHAVVRQGLRLLLEAEDDLAVVGESSDLAQTTALWDHAPAVVLLDLHMGRELSLSALFELRSASPSTAVVILTMEDDPAFVAPAWNAGAAGDASKRRPGPTWCGRSGPSPRAAATSIRRSAGGRSPAATTSSLTERELEVLRLVALGHTNSEIATRMYISPRTVETHRANLQAKLGLTGRPELVRYALEHGVIHR